MSPVSSSTSDLRVGEVAQRARVDVELGQRRVSVVLTSRRPRSPSAAVGVVALTGHGLDVDEAGPRLHDPREQREVLAQRVPLELRREVEVAQAGWPSNTMPYISQHSRSCQSAPG